MWFVLPGVFAGFVDDAGDEDLGRSGDGDGFDCGGGEGDAVLVEVVERHVEWGVFSLDTCLRCDSVHADQEENQGFSRQKIREVMRSYVVFTFLSFCFNNFRFLSLDSLVHAKIKIL